MHGLTYTTSRGRPGQVIYLHGNDVKNEAVAGRCSSCQSCQAAVHSLCFCARLFEASRCGETLA